jgi:uncharacterized protein (DUF1501 family)
VSVNVSLAGQTYFQASEVAKPYVMGANGPVQFAALPTTGAGPARRASYESVLTSALGSSANTTYERAYASVQQRAIQFADRVSGAVASGYNFTALPNTGTLSSLQQQLRTVAKIISSRQSLGLSRQIFFVSTGGFDQHDDLVRDQPLLLANVSASIKSFYDSIREIGMENNVTLFTHSDFGRTLTSNGDGSDHAWGGLQLVAGGAVRGGRFYGAYPVLENGGAWDVGGGRIIPTVSADQYAATLAGWFGVQDQDLPKVAPSINNFTARNLGFMV